MDINKNNAAIPGAIIISGIIIAGAILLNGHGVSSMQPLANPGVIGAGEINMKSISAEDHILGNLGSKVTIVEYADLECPYCKAYEPELQKVLSSYGTSSGKVAWVYRHFTIHSKAPYEAQASECAAELGGNDAFFKFIDHIFSVTKADNNLDPAVLTQTAVDLGLDKAAFQKCLDSGKYKQKVQDSYDDAVKAGGRGTPYTVLVTADGHKYPLTDKSGNAVGAVSSEDLKGAIDNLLK